MTTTVARQSQRAGQLLRLNCRRIRAHLHHDIRDVRRRMRAMRAARMQVRHAALAAPRGASPSGLAPSSQARLLQTSNSRWIAAKLPCCLDPDSGGGPCHHRADAVGWPRTARHGARCLPAPQAPCDRILAEHICNYCARLVALFRDYDLAATCQSSLLQLGQRYHTGVCIGPASVVA